MAQPGFLSSTIGQKVVMALSGILLVDARRCDS
jgi:hypothetical protein